MFEAERLLIRINEGFREKLDGIDDPRGATSDRVRDGVTQGLRVEGCSDRQ
jgi:hypothetical protein